MKEGHKVEIIPRGENASPDLRVQAIGGTQDWVNIECYQPKIFDGGSTVEQKQIEMVIKRSMKKAERQLEKATPGIFAICGFNQTRQTLENLKEMILSRLQKTERSHLCGMIVMMLGIMYRKNKEHTSFTPTISFDFISNPNYFGRVDIDVSTPTDDLHLIKGPFTDVRTEDLFSQKIQKLSEAHIASSESVPKETTQSIVEQRLKLVKEPEPKSCVIIYSENKNLPFFEGEGNINSRCSRCGAMLVKRAWKLSISNIILKCPSCQSYNEFPKLKLPEHPILGSIAIVKENYNFTGTVVLKKGAIIVGL
jgi:phage FluMu protein Com